MEFKYNGVTIRCVNPEALPFAKNNLAKLIIELAQNKIERESKKINTEDRENPNSKFSKM